MARLHPPENLLRGTAAALLLALSPCGSLAGETDAEALRLEAGQQGTKLESLTVEGENRAQVDFQRPSLSLELDALQVAGLAGGSARELLLATEPDLLGPFLAASTRRLPAVLARPWFAAFATGKLVRFQPKLDKVERWSFVIADSRGDTAAVFAGRGNPPEMLGWDGRRQDGQPALPGLVYSSVLTAWDRAENHRNFVGEGFTLPPYRLVESGGETLLMSGAELAPRKGGGAPPLLLGAIDRLNQGPADRPLRLVISARSYGQAEALSAQVASVLAERLLGDPLRLQTTVDVDPRAPEAGVLIFSSRPLGG
jgi:hypothetical protein